MQQLINDSTYDLQTSVQQSVIKRWLTIFTNFAESIIFDENSYYPK